MAIFLRKFTWIILVLIIQSSLTNAQSNNADSLMQVYHAAKKQYEVYEQRHGNYIKTKNVRMHYLSWGDPAKPCLIWAHGSMNNGYELLNIADSLVKSGYYVIAIDYYGHGLTPIPDHEVSIYHVADDIKFLMDQLLIKKAFIGGFSRGGYIATAFYDSYPESVLGLVLEDGGSVAANTYLQKLTQKQLEVIARSFDEKSSNPWDFTYTNEFDAFKSLYNKNETDNQFSILALLNRMKSGKWEIIYSKMMKLFHLENSQQFLDLTLRPAKVPLFARSMVMIEPALVFRNLKVPILILDPVSSNDRIPFERQNEALKTAHPNLITHITYPDTEHNIHYAHPQKFIEDLTAFFHKSMSL